MSLCRGANITLFSPLQRINQLLTQVFRIDFHGLTAEKNPIFLFNLTGAARFFAVRLSADVLSVH